MVPLGFDSGPSPRPYTPAARPKSEPSPAKAACRGAVLLGSRSLPALEPPWSPVSRSKLCEANVSLGHMRLSPGSSPGRRPRRTKAAFPPLEDAPMSPAERELVCGALRSALSPMNFAERTRVFGALQSALSSEAAFAINAAAGEAAALGAQQTSTSPAKQLLDRELEEINRRVAALTSGREEGGGEEGEDEQAVPGQRVLYEGRMRALQQEAEALDERRGDVTRSLAVWTAGHTDGDRMRAAEAELDRYEADALRTLQGTGGAGTDGAACTPASAVREPGALHEEELLSMRRRGEQLSAEHRKVVGWMQVQLTRLSAESRVTHSEAAELRRALAQLQAAELELKRELDLTEAGLQEQLTRVAALESSVAPQRSDLPVAEEAAARQAALRAEQQAKQEAALQAALQAAGRERAALIEEPRLRDEALAEAGAQLRRAEEARAELL